MSNGIGSGPSRSSGNNNVGTSSNGLSSRGTGNGSGASEYQASAFRSNEDELIYALAELGAGAQEGLRELAGQIRENNRRKEVVRHLQNLVRQIDAGRIEGPNDEAEGKRSMIRHEGTEAAFQEIERVLGDNPWLAGSDIETHYQGLFQSTDAEKRMSALGEACKTLGDNLSDMTQQQTIDIQIAQNQASKAQDAMSNWIKAKHGMAMTPINNMRG
jgi:hypothetical protein